MAAFHLWEQIEQMMAKNGKRQWKRLQTGTQTLSNEPSSILPHKTLNSEKK